jgi:pimeloyl-ACP methyl ester carboxylesterase
MAETSTPVQIETFAWSHGYRRVLADQVDHENHLVQGQRLASQVSAYRTAHPKQRVYLVGHSAGCAVVLAAAEAQPPGSVNRIILLAPSVCATYDLRPALRATREGIDVFHSHEDRLVLGLGIGIVGTTEGGCRTPAGRDGFVPIIQCSSDAVLYGKLRQHPWVPALRWSGNSGGHYGNHETGFLRAYVLPLLTSS